MTRGFTLIELMVSILIGSLIILASGAVLSSVVSFQTTVQENNKVDTAINEILELMERDIKRAGFFMPGKVSLADSNVTHITSLLPVSQSSLTEESVALTGKTEFHRFLTFTDLGTNQACVLLTYDLNQDGCIGKANNGTPCVTTDATTGKILNNTKNVTDEIFGYRWIKGRDGDGYIATRETGVTRTAIDTCEKPTGSGDGCAAWLFADKNNGFCSSANNWTSVTKKNIAIDAFSVKEITNYTEHFIGNGKGALYFPAFKIEITGRIKNSVRAVTLTRIVTLENPAQ